MLAEMYGKEGGCAPAEDSASSYRMGRTNSYQQLHHVALFHAAINRG
jgi:hypothetical protein